MSDRWQGRRRPPRAGEEKESLEGWLDFHRDTLLWKVVGLTDDDLTRSVIPSGWSLLGLIKHMGWVERGWFANGFADLRLPDPWTKEDPDSDWRIEPGETRQGILGFYRDECERSRVITQAASLDDLACGPDLPPDGLNLRWIMLHMIEETARHNGHADIVRELIDGKTGD